LAWCIEDALEDLSELDEMAGIQELVQDTSMSLSAHPGCPVTILEEP
jgi:hypothetical protein